MAEHWLMPLGFGLPLTLVIFVLLVRSWKRQDFLATMLQSLAVLLMGIALIGPMTMINEQAVVRALNCAAMIDLSSSMAITDNAQKTRLDIVRQNDFSPQIIKQLTPQVQWQIFTFAQELAASSPDQLAGSKPQGQQTRLLKSLRTLDRQLPKDTSIVVFSDGNDTSDEQVINAMQMLKNTHRVVHTMAVGQVDQQANLQSYAWAEPSICQPGQMVTLHLQLEGCTTLPQQSKLKVQLVNDGKTDPQKRSLLVGLNNSMHLTQQISFSQPGLHTLTWQVAEENAPSLQAFCIVECVDMPVNVLLLEGRPHWLTRNAARALQMDDKLQLTARYALGQSRELQLTDSTQAIAGGDLDFAKRDVIVLGIHTQQMLDETMQKHLLQWVIDGGGLLWLRGTQVNRAIWPSQLLADDPMPSDQAAMLFEGLHLPWQANASKKDLLRYKPLGQGRVILLDESQLALSAAGNPALDLLMVRMIGALAKPLAQGQGQWADMHLDHYAARVGDEVAVSLTVRNAVIPRLQLTFPDGVNRIIQLQQDPANPLKWACRLTIEQAGLHQLTLLSHEQLKQAFVSRPSHDEQMHLSANHALLKQIAHETGGAFFTTPDELINKLINTQQHSQIGQNKPIMKQLFNHPLLVIPVIALWICGWYVTRRKGGI